VTFLLAFVLFSTAIAAMAVGVMLSGRKLSSSCGGLSKLGEASTDCSCARKQADLCGDGADHELVELAEIGWPMKRTQHRHERGSDSARGESLEV
jgi:hypothetical protein